MKRALFTLAALVANVFAADEEPLRTFKDQKDREIVARLVKVEGSEVTLEREDRKTFRIDVGTLCEEDRAFAALWLTKQQIMNLELACKKTPVEAKGSRVYCFEVALTNRESTTTPPLEVHYQLFNGTSGNTVTGTQVTPAGTGKFLIKPIDQFKTGAGLTLPEAASKSVATTTTYFSDGTSDSTYAVSRTALAGVKLAFFVDGQLVRTHSHGRVIRDEDKVPGK